jgi:signal transduction histidine kinase
MVISSVAFFGVCLLTFLIYWQGWRFAEYNEQNVKVYNLLLTILLLFVGTALVLCLRFISLILRALKQLITILNALDVEDDLPNTLSKLNIEIPEVSSVARSLEKLFQRLRGYRAMNVRRLLIEKRRADIIAASISDGIFLLRGEEILYVNPIAEKILGLKPGAFIRGLKVSKDGAFETNLGMKSVIKAVSRTLPVEFTLEVDERRFYYLLQSFPISYDLIEKIEHSVGSAVEQILDRFQANTLVLAQDVTLVREEQEAKSHFLATLSHEVKTPVTSLTMATRLLKKSVDQIPNPMHQNLIITCSDDVDRLRGLLDDLLTVSRFDALAQRLEIQTIDLGKLLTHSVQSFQVHAKERGVQLVHQVINRGKPIVIGVDATKIAWALSNLMTNALRHTPRGGKVCVSLEILEEGVEVGVQDTGPGIERHRQDRIFDKFNPYYDLRVARSGSVGAGLAIAREIVVAHGGHIWVVSEPGHGAKFCFRLPLKHPNSVSSRDDVFGGQLRKYYGTS